ncbi:unnamed protein product, partial [Discosporangium mesarthrocarpum]
MGPVKSLVVLALLAGFVDVDALRLPTTPNVGMLRQQVATTTKMDPNPWHTRSRGLRMATRATTDEFSVLDEEEEQPRQSSLMDDLDAILEDTAGGMDIGLDELLGNGKKSPTSAPKANKSSVGPAPAVDRDYSSDLDLDGLLGRSPSQQRPSSPRNFDMGDWSVQSDEDNGGWGDRAERQSLGGKPRGPRVPMQKEVKGDRSVSYIEVDDSAAGPVTSKDIDDKTVKMLADRGIEIFTPVQATTYDHILSGRDIIGKSRTGTGKTIAFGLPVIQHLARFSDRTPGWMSKRGRSPQLLVVCPTRELARQVYEELASLAAPHGMRAEVFHGGVSYGPQESALRQGLDILVATPGRVIDHLSRGTLDLGSVKHAVLDEADEMLNMGFADDIENIFSYINVRECQVLLFSATLPGWVRNISKQYTDNPLTVDAVGTDTNKLATTVKHVAIEVSARHRAHVLEDIITVYGKGSHAIVFTQTKRECDELAAGGSFKTLTSQVLHGDIGQAQRDITINQFRNKKFQVLVATDVAARGIDISDIDLVVQYRPPNDPGKAV